jgi:hypothetical protein
LKNIEKQKGKEKHARETPCLMLNENKIKACKSQPPVFLFGLFSDSFFVCSGSGASPTEKMPAEGDIVYKKEGKRHPNITRGWSQRKFRPSIT